jgi:hypothetical protein
MIKKYSVLIGITISLILFAVAISMYPGGTYQNKNTIGFSWSKNYISNLFEANAINGSENSAKIWAYGAMYTGILTMPFTFLIVTPLHNLMLNISSFLFWNCIVAITVFIFMTKLHFFKIYNSICLLIFVYAVYVHTSSNWNLLLIIAKVNAITTLLLIIGLEYFTNKEDFATIKPKKKHREQVISSK